MKTRMLFHKLFDDHVLDDVRSIYKDINELLIQRSILPKIRFGIRRAAGGIGRRPRAAPAQGAAEIAAAVHGAPAMAAGGNPMMAMPMSMGGADAFDAGYGGDSGDG